VNIGGNVGFSSNSTSLYGGFASGSDDVFTGNTLNVNNYSGSSVKGIENFQYYNFILPATQGSTPVLTATDTVVLGNGAGTGSTVTNVSTFGGTGPLKAGSIVKLISADSLTGNLASSQATGQHGGALSYDWLIERQGNDLIAKLLGVQVDPQTKVLSTGFLAGMGQVNQTGDLVAKQTMLGNGVFFDMAGGMSRYKTGSHVDLSGLSLITGVSHRERLAFGRLTYGGFFEYGYGSYDTFNSFGGSALRNGGNLQHFGGGVWGGWIFATNFTPTPASGRAVCGTISTAET
jgi:hypothetical protein